MVSKYDVVDSLIFVSIEIVKIVIVKKVRGMISKEKKLIVVDSLIFVSIENVIDKTLEMIQAIKLIVVDSLIFVSIENVIDKNVRYDI